MTEEMTVNAVKAGMLALMALLLVFINMKANSSPVLKWVTFIGLWVALIGAGYFTVLVVIP